MQQPQQNNQIHPSGSTEPLSIHVGLLAAHKSSSSNDDNSRWTDDRATPLSPCKLDALASAPLVDVSTIAAATADTLSDQKKTSKSKNTTGKSAGVGATADATAVAKLPRQRKVANAAKRARRSEIEKQSRQRRMVRS